MIGANVGTQTGIIVSEQSRHEIGTLGGQMEIQREIEIEIDRHRSYHMYRVKDCIENADMNADSRATSVRSERHVCLLY